MGEERLAFLLGGVALAFKCAERVLLHLVVQLHLEPLVVAEVAHGRRRDEVDLAQPIAHQLILVVIGALQAVIIVGAVLHETTRQHAREKRHEKEQKHGKHLSQENPHVCVLFLPIAIPALLSMVLSLVVMAMLSWSAGPWLLAEEHEVEEFLGRDKLLVKVAEIAPMEVMVVVAGGASALRLSPLEGVRVADLVVLASLGGVREARHGRIELLEGLVGLGRTVFVRVHLEALLLVGSLQLAVVGVLVDTEQRVVVLASENVPRELLLLRRELPLGRLWGRGALGGGGARRPRRLL